MATKASKSSMIREGFEKVGLNVPAEHIVDWVWDRYEVEIDKQDVHTVRSHYKKKMNGRAPGGSQDVPSKAMLKEEEEQARYDNEESLGDEPDRSYEEEMKAANQTLLSEILLVKNTATSLGGLDRLKEVIGIYEQIVK